MTKHVAPPSQPAVIKAGIARAVLDDAARLLAEKYGKTPQAAWDLIVACVRALEEEGL